MSPTQVQNFFKRYELLEYYPHFDEKNNKQIDGFHACLFQDKESKEYTLAIRGSYDIEDYGTDGQDLLLGSIIPFEHYYNMINFYGYCADKYKEIKEPKSLNIVGHSLGGCLAQLFTLSFADYTQSKQSIINEVYTYNAPGAKNLKPQVTLNIDQNYEIDENIINSANPAQAMFYKIMDRNPDEWFKNFMYNVIDSLSRTYIEQNILSGLRIYFSKIPKDELKPHRIFLYIDNISHTLYIKIYPITDTFLKAYQTLIDNYNNRNEKKLSISDKVFHIESKNQASLVGYYNINHAKESYLGNATQHLGKDIEGNYFSINLNFDGMDSHSIVETTKVLYFYEYLYEMNEKLIDEQSKQVQLEYEKDTSKENKDDDIPKEFFEKHSEIDTKKYKESKKALEYCNLVAFSIHNVLYSAEVERAMNKKSYNDTLDIGLVPNWLYATIDKMAFEATILTKQKKFPLKKDTSNIIEAMLYLQENKVYIEILKKEKIEDITKEAPLSHLFAVFEYLFFICVDENKNPLIEDKQTACSLLGYKTPKIKIFCLNPNPNAMLIECYKSKTLDFCLYTKVAQ